MKQDFLVRAIVAGQQAGVPFPEYQACEAALESNWGQSRIALEGNNLFGRKASKHWAGPTMDVLTWEDFNHNGKRDPDETVTAKWCKFDSWDECFRDRMAVLIALAPHFPHYAAALDAQDGETFIKEVSQTWATDACRAEKVLAIHRQYCSKPA